MAKRTRQSRRLAGLDDECEVLSLTATPKEALLLSAPAGGGGDTDAERYTGAGQKLILRQVQRILSSSVALAS